MKINLLLDAISYGSTGGFLATVLRPKRPLWLTLIINMILGITAYHFVQLWLVDSGISPFRIKALGWFAAIISGAVLNIILSLLESIQKDPLSIILRIWGKK